ncbi:MAG: hypothetical protein IKJ55_03910 [Clostridia bacterium]|nr:hypothetical protein [Clostridia bacterium]
MNFSRITWQQNIISGIQNGIRTATLRHAILFIGASESAKDLAHATANTLLCEAGGIDMCKNCPACKKLLAGSHPDKIVLEKLKDKKSYGVDESRDLIGRMYIKPFEGKRKIFILEDASALTPAAQNALLKVIEEPPHYGTVILCAKKEEDLLPTILSRITHKFKLAPPTTTEIQNYLEQKYPEKKAICGFCAAFSQGDPSLAEALLAEDGAQNRRRRLVLFLDRLCGNEKSCIFDFCGYLKDNAEDIAQIADYLFAILKDMLFIKLSLPQLLNDDLKADLTSLAQKWSVQAIEKTTNRLSELLTALKNAAAFEGSVLNFLLDTWEDLHDRNCRN